MTYSSEEDLEVSIHFKRCQCEPLVSVGSKRQTDVDGFGGSYMTYSSEEDPEVSIHFRPMSMRVFGSV